MRQGNDDLYTKYFNIKKTSQKDVIPGKEHLIIKNSAGGNSFNLDDWGRFKRFLMLGTDGGTYYISEKALTLENAQIVAKLAGSFRGMEVVQEIVNVSTSGRAYKNDPALFALAVCSSPKFVKDSAVRKAALNNMSRVARTGTDMFKFINYTMAVGRGWGRAMKRAVQDWYQNKDAERLCYQLVKYQEREGMNHRNVLRMAKPIPIDNDHKMLYGWVTGKLLCKGDVWEHTRSFGTKLNCQTEVTEVSWDVPKFLDGYIKVHFLDKASSTFVKDAVNIISDNNLTREMLPTELLKFPEVWEVMLHNGMPMTAMIRNLGNMSKVGLIKPLSKIEQEIAQLLTNKDELKKARIHPLSVLLALKTYASGHGFRSQGESWTVSQKIVEALDEAFTLAFANVEPTGKRFFLGLDVSGSMDFPMGNTNITYKEATGVLAMITMRTEPTTYVVGFQNKLVDLGINACMSLDDVLKKISELPFGNTDCSIPMLYALDKGLEVDAFVVYTDSETYAGKVYPSQALQLYRDKTGIPAKLIVVGMTTNGFTIADPEDSGMMDIVGFDASLPTIISNFVR
jgi:60 kDa SS-A/Ro ribonucleoprotein